MALQLVLLDLQHGSTLRRVLVSSLTLTVVLKPTFLPMNGLRCFVVHGDEATYLLDLDFAVVEDTCERFVRCNFVHINQPAVTAQEIGAVTLAHFVGDP